MSFVSAFAALVVGPMNLSGLDVVLLSFLGPASEQNSDLLAVLSKINAIAWTKIYFEFQHATTDTLCI